MTSENHRTTLHCHPCSSLLSAMHVIMIIIIRTRWYRERVTNSQNSGTVTVWSTSALALVCNNNVIVVIYGIYFYCALQIYVLIRIVCGALKLCKS